MIFLSTYITLNVGVLDLICLKASFFLDKMETTNEEVITPSNYIDKIFHSCEEEVAEVPSGCLLLQADITEETLLHMNILKQDEESSGLCSDHHSYFTSVSAFGD